MDINDPTAESRKQDHIELAFKSQVKNIALDNRFYYEPMLAAHSNEVAPTSFLGKSMRTPIWVSSMTGGTQLAATINRNLAKACGEFGMGMGLGSCRSLLENDDYLADFDVRQYLGDQPLYANLGIAQIEKLLADKASDKVAVLLNKLQADGLFIHVNPFQEWLQPEGDIIERPPIETIQEFLETQNCKVIVKEVGQGMGKASLKALMQLPIEAIEFAAHGGTNFSKLELLRSNVDEQNHFEGVTKIGHSAEDMVTLVNELLAEQPSQEYKCQQFIISGGVKNFLDGFYLINKLNATAVYGQASTLLKHAKSSYSELHQFLNYEIKGLALAQAYLSIRN